MLAKKGEGFTSPNPCVGAVIVKGGKILAEGWHKKAGEDHAEIVAIKKISKKSDLKGSSLYVTLEPCCHTGKTPPCVNSIVDAGIKEVFVGMVDPFAKVKGKGVKFLKKHGVKVEILKPTSELAKTISDINQPFIKSVKLGLPYVILKAGISLDGKIATSTGDSKWITSEASRDDSRVERSKCDCVIVGSGTVDKDNPNLFAAALYNSKRILRIVIDKFLSSNVNKNIFRDKNVFVATMDMASKINKDKFTKAGIKFKFFGEHVVSIKKLLVYLNSIGIQSVFVEGGGSVHGHFYDAAIKDKTLVDKVIFYIAPKLIGGEKSLSVIGGTGYESISKIDSFKNSELKKIGEDFKFTGVFNSY